MEEHDFEPCMWRRVSDPLDVGTNLHLALTRETRTATHSAPARRLSLRILLTASLRLRSLKDTCLGTRSSEGRTNEAIAI